MDRRAAHPPSRKSGSARRPEPRHSTAIRSAGGARVDGPPSASSSRPAPQYEHTRIHRRRPRVSRAARRELATFALAYLTYFGVRAITEGEPWKAFANASAVFRLETHLGIDWEGPIQALVVGNHALVDAADAVYIYGHWPVLIVSGVMLFRYRRPYYYRLRNACMLTGLVGLAIFALFPVAPPRLTDLPVIDTVTRDSEGYRLLFPPALVNQFAAMPSFHAGWDLLVGIVVFQATKNKLLRAFAVVMPVAMAFSVVATANHFVADVIAGTTIVLLGLLVVVRLERRHGLLRGRAHAQPVVRSPHGHAVRRATRGERPQAPARGSGARPAAR
jgi:hypothetical protein